jgi:hypothetical protein
MRKIVALIASRPDSAIACVLALVWLASILMTNPAGNFPLNDDWSYGRTVKILLEEHRLSLDGWGAPTFAFQALYGALFCLPFGFSFTALRISTLVLGCAGVIAFYCLLRLIGSRKDWAICGSIALMFNPVYFVNAFTFMTDVPSTALTIISSFYFLRSLRFGSTQDKIIGFVLLCCATLTRQITPPVALAYGLVMLLRDGMSWRNLFRAAWPLFGVIALLAGYNELIAALGPQAELNDTKQKEITFTLARLGYSGYAAFVASNTFTTFVYLCLFTLPLTVLLLPLALNAGGVERIFRSRLSFYLSLAVGIAGCFALAVIVRNFYWSGNSLNASLTLGSCEISDCALADAMPEFSIRALLFRSQDYVLALSVAVALCFGIAAATQATKMLSRANSFQVQVAVFSLLAAVGVCGPFMLFRMFDRYILPAVPFALCFVVAVAQILVIRQSAAAPASVGSRRVFRVLAALFLAANAALAVAGTHDYLAWNRARWQATYDLVEKQGIPPKSIDGGFAMTGWYLFAGDESMKRRWQSANRTANPFPRSAFARYDAPFLIGFASSERSRTDCEKFEAASYPVATWTMSQDLRIGVFERYTSTTKPPTCR